MPWCPVCHAEYREGVKVCRQCGAELVDTPPGAGERYQPPSGNGVEAQAARVARAFAVSGWGRQIVEGVRLFGQSSQLMLRMRNLWLVLVVLTALAAISALRSPVPMDMSTLVRMREGSGSFPADVGRDILRMWFSPLWAITHLSSDLRTGLSTPLAYFSWLLGRFSFRTYPSGAATVERWWDDPRLLAGSVATTLLGVFFLAGVLRWVLATVRGEEQTAARFWEGVRQSFWPLLAWMVVLDGVWTLAVMPATRAGGSLLSQATFTALALLFLPLVLTSKAIVVLRPPLYLAPVASARIFARNLLVVVGFAVPFIVLHDLIWGIDGALHFYYYSVSDPYYDYRYAMPVLAFVMQVAKVALELTITTAFVILVARWQEADRGEPAAPEAAAA